MPVAVLAKLNEPRRKRTRCERQAPRPDREGRPRLREAAAQEAVVQMRLVRLEHLLAVLEPAGDDERRADDRYGEDEQGKEEGDGRPGLEQALHRDRRKHEAEQERAR